MSPPRFRAQPLAGAAAGGAKLFKHALHQIRSRRCCVRELVFEVHRLPFEGAQLMKRLYLHPFHVLHGRDKPSDTVDVLWIVGPSPGGSLGGPGFLVRSTASLWLGSFIFWATILLIKRVPSLLGPVVALWTVPIVFRTSLAPGWLLTPVETPEHGVGRASAFAVLVIAACLVVLERHLALRQLD